VKTPPLPNFIFAGAPKTGSSTLWELLCQHPDFCPCQVKEPFFFDFHFNKGEAYYRSLFSNWKQEKIIAEATVWYMRWPDCPERMYQLLPDVKLLFMLRNPVERARSDFFRNIIAGHYLPSQKLENLQHNDYRMVLRSGLYSQHLRRFQQHFPDSQLKILVYEEARRDWRHTAASIFEFLGIDPDVAIKEKQDRMVTRKLRSFPVLDKITGPGILRSPARFIWRRSRHVRDLFLTQGKNLLGPSDLQFLKHYYQNDVEQLSVELSRDMKKIWAWDANT